MDYQLSSFSEDYIVEIILPFSEQMIRLMISELGIEPSSDLLSIKPCREYAPSELNIGIVVHFKEDVAVILQMPYKFAMMIDQKLFRLDTPEDDHHGLLDIGLEYINIVVGQALINFRYKVEISTPFELETLSANEEDRFIHVPFMTDFGVVDMIYTPAKMAVPKR